VKSKNHGRKSVNQTLLWSKLWLQESLQSQHKLCSITSQIAIQQRWNKEQETWKIHKLQLPYATYMSLFRWLLNNSVEAPWGMNLLTKFQHDQTVDETAAAIRRFSSSIETLMKYEINFSLFKQLLQDPNSQIEVTQSMNLLTKFQPDPMVNKASVAAGSFWAKLSLFILFSLWLFCWLLSLCSKKTLKVNTGPPYRKWA